MLPSESKSPGAAPAESSAYDLKFVPVDDECSDGGWYRELPDSRIEVMSHARLERVALGETEPEDKAREIVSQIAARPKS
jgi:hypothetical protein